MCTMKYSNWSVTTWCKKMNYNAITKKGYEKDRELVEASHTIYKNPHNKNRKTKQPNVQVNVRRRRAGNI